MGEIIITTECVADIPLELVEEKKIGIIYYTIKTDMGQFRDTDEITALNVMEYMMGGEKKALSIIPTAQDYQTFFENCLNEYEEIVHISISSDVSQACLNARRAAEQIPDGKQKIHVIDSRHLSSGQGLMVLEAVKAKEEGKTSGEIVEQVENLISKVSTSFLAYNADYLYYNDKVSERVMKICQYFHLHPVLAMVEGKLTLKGVYIGNYEKAARKYIKKAVGKHKSIRKELGFITYAGCNHKNLDAIKTMVQDVIGFETLYEQPASASISCNCGPNTFGVLYIHH